MTIDYLPWNRPVMLADRVCMRDTQVELTYAEAARRVDAVGGGGGAGRECGTLPRNLTRSRSGAINIVRAAEEPRRQDRQTSPARLALIAPRVEHQPALAITVRRP